MSGDAVLGRVALITGAASGLGAAAAELYAAEGAEVVFAADTRAEPLQITVDGLRAQGLNVVPLVLDVSSEEAWTEAVATISSTAGRLDTLVNNAGLSGVNRAYEQYGTEYWAKLLAVNLTGPFFGMRACWPLLKASGTGSIVNVSSVQGIVGFKGLHPGYLASKGGLRTMSKGMAIEMADDNIRVNSVHPGAMPAMVGSTWDADEATEKAIMKRLVPLGRKAEYSEVAETLLFLGSTKSSYITGVELYVDGGWLAQ